MTGPTDVEGYKIWICFARGRGKAIIVAIRLPVFQPEEKICFFVFSIHFFLMFLSSFAMSVNFFLLYFNPLNKIGEKRKWVLLPSFFLGGGGRGNCCKGSSSALPEADGQGGTGWHGRWHRRSFAL